MTTITIGEHLNQYLTNARPLLNPQLADIGLVLAKFWSSVSQYPSQYMKRYTCISWYNVSQDYSQET